MAFVVKIASGQKINPRLLNIDGSDDVFFRYKMRQLFVQVIGKGKMIRTMLLNIEDVAKDLKVDPSYITSYFGYEIGAQSKFDPKKPERERASVSGEHDSSYMSNILKKFIQDFILCPNCKLPECVLNPDKKTQKVTMNCKGCGASTTTEMNDKLKRFIFNHPKGMVKEEKAPKGKPKPDPNAKPDPAKAAPVKRERRRPKEEEEDDGTEWSVDASAAAAEARRQAKLPDKLKELVVDERVDPKEALTGFLLSQRSQQDILAEVKRIHQEYNLQIKSFAETVFDILINRLKPKESISEHQIVLSQFAEESLEAQLAYLTCLQKWAEKDETVLKTIPFLFKQMYDEDIVEEDTFLKWEEANSSSAIAAKAAPFLNWLKTAQEQSEDSEEDSEEEDSDDE